MSVTTHFQWARQLTAGEPGKTLLDSIINSITEIQKQLDALGPDVAGRSPRNPGSPSFRVLIQMLKQQAGGLPRGISRLVTEIVAEPDEAVGGATR
jgi:hypothetical protein